MTSNHRHPCSSILLAVACGSLFLPLGEAGAAESKLQLLFTSQGKSARINVDGSGQQYFNFSVPNQATWQPGPIFPNGKRLIFLSMEPRRDVPGKPFEEYYTKTPTHLWIHDLATGDLQEICTQDRLAVFVTPALLLGDDRILIQVVRDKVGQIYSVRMDGSDARGVYARGEGMPYGLSLSPNRQRVAFHLASPTGYQVWTSDVKGEKRQRIAADPNHLYPGGRIVHAAGGRADRPCRRRRPRSRRPTRFSLFMHRAGRYPLLTAAEEVALPKRIERGDAEAKERMINSNLGLVISIAKRYQRKGPAAVWISSRRA